MYLFLFWGLFYLFIFSHNVVQGKTICEPGRFSVNGVCVQQFNFCPVNFIFLNGICFPTSSGNCLKGQIWINNDCCTETCLDSCETTANCPCCGKMNTHEAQSCNISFMPTCATPILPCISAVPKPTSAPVVCSPGSVRVKGHCLLVHCNGIYRNGRCIRLQCPVGSFWLKDKCIAEKPDNYHLAYNHSYNVEIHSSQTNVVNQNANNIWADVLYKHEQAAQNWEDILKEDESEQANWEEFITPAPPTQKTTEVPTTWEEILKEDAQDMANTVPCCQVVSPRICKQHNETKAWKCFNSKHEHCGAICQAKTICLLPAKPRQCLDYIVVVPPPKIFTEILRANATTDCSGCVLGDYNKCHTYCYHYAPCSDLSSDLSPSDCQLLNEEKFCDNNSGLKGCLKVDASYDSLSNFA